MDIRRFRDEGLTCLDHDGAIVGKPDLEMMNRVLDYFIKQERYERCVVMRNRIVEYCQQEEG
jgi:hypothetical protein